MSFERFLSSDVYIFEHAGGYIQCCGCNLIKPDEGEIFGFANLITPRLALAHLDLHEAAGDDIGSARVRIEKEYEDLDTTIEPYETPPEVRERVRNLLKLAQENNDKVD
jgi:hypothetical protein